MKCIIVTILLFNIVWACNNFIAEPIIEIQDTHINIRFTRKTTDDQLHFIKTELQKKNIEIQFPSVQKDGNLLTELSFEIKFNGNVGTAKTKFINLRGKDFGLMINFANGEIHIGDLEKQKG